MSDNKDGMVRPSDDGVHIEAPQAQTPHTNVKSFSTLDTNSNSVEAMGQRYRWLVCL